MSNALRSKSSVEPTYSGAPRAPKPTHRHAGTFITLQEQVPDELRTELGYTKTYDFPGDYIDGYHRYLATVAVHDGFPFINMGVAGWLLRADALKLYELAYFAGEDALEIGSYQGLSTTIIANALHNSERPGSLYSVDLMPENSQGTREGLERRQVPGREMVKCMLQDGTKFLKRAKEVGRRFSFAFIDHAHDYEPMVDCCKLLPHVLRPGAFVLFHDYNDPRNLLLESDFAVYQAVTEHLLPDQFEFWGTFACCGLYRRL